MKIIKIDEFDPVPNGKYLSTATVTDYDNCRRRLAHSGILYDYYETIYGTKIVHYYEVEDDYRTPKEIEKERAWNEELEAYRFRQDAKEKARAANKLARKQFLEKLKFWSKRR